MCVLWLGSSWPMNTTSLHYFTIRTQFSMMLGPLSKWAAKHRPGTQAPSTGHHCPPLFSPVPYSQEGGSQDPACSQGSEDQWKAELMISWFPRSGKDTRLGGASFSHVGVHLTWQVGPLCWANKDALVREDLSICSPPRPSLVQKIHSLSGRAWEALRQHSHSSASTFKLCDVGSLLSFSGILSF